jgi:DeoR/GlpR family transcriptional regulator of sugar metabolism
MLKKTRLDQIVRLIRDQGSVEISELCRLFDVTEMTARRDLDTLAAAGRVTRTHGGALLPADDVLVEKPFEARMAMNHERKEAIARVALEHNRGWAKALLQQQYIGLQPGEPDR